jgi:hypothetical protein
VATKANQETALVSSFSLGSGKHDPEHHAALVPAPRWLFYSTGVWNLVRSEACAAKDVATCPELPRHEVCARSGGLVGEPNAQPGDNLPRLLMASGVPKWVWYVHGTYGWNRKMKHADVYVGRECLLTAAKEAHVPSSNLIDTWMLTTKAKSEWISYGGGFHLSDGDTRHPVLGPVAQALVRIAFRRLGLS